MSPTPAPYELAYVADLKRLLQQIRTSNGYLTDAGEHVFVSDERLDPEDDVDICLIVLDPDEDLVRQDGYVRDVSLRLEVEAFVRVGSAREAREQSRALARQVLTDIRRAVLQGSRGNSWSAGAPIDVTLDGRFLPPIESGSRWQLGVQPVLLQVREEFQGL